MKVIPILAMTALAISCALAQAMPTSFPART